MTELQKIYFKARTERGMRHRQAVDYVARVTGLDSGSVARCLARAKREDERDEKRRKKETEGG